MWWYFFYFLQSIKSFYIIKRIIFIKKGESMIARIDIRTIISITGFFILLTVIFNMLEKPVVKKERSFILSHAVMILNTLKATTDELELWENIVHYSLHDLNSACSVDHASNKKSQKYIHKKDHVFITHAHGEIGKYCFHIPSHLSFEDFVKIAGPFYKEKGLSVTFHKDYKIQLTNLDSSEIKLLQLEDENSVIGFEGQMLSLELYQKCAGLSISDIDQLISQELNLKNKKQLEILKKIYPLFDWHLKVPTVGIVPNKNLPDYALPLSWHFSAWELAPKKGAGITVAVIDTGAASFNLPEFGLQKHPNTKSSPSVLDLSLNLVAENGLSPLHQLALLVKKYCKNISVNKIEAVLKDLVIDFLKTKNEQNFTDFLIKNASDLAVNETALNNSGTVALQDILYGDEGILPNHLQGFFSLTDIDGKSVIVQLLPSPQVKKGMEFISTHGTFTQGIINAQPQFNGDISGIAPEVTLLPIKALEDDGSTTKQNLDTALRLAANLKPDIVNLSLKSGEDFDSSDPDDLTMKYLIGLCDYVVAASGNDGDSRYSSYAPSLAYPAKFDRVEFDVAGFKFEANSYPIGSFSQREKNIGPKFAAPGFNMVSSAIDFNTGEMCKMFMGGTSAAVPVITGCVALVLGEFKNVFSRETILKVLYASTMKMDGSLPWKNDIGLGMIDLRTALLCLHTLEKISVEKINVGLQENDLINQILSLIYSNSNKTSRELGIVDIRSDFASFEKKFTDGNFSGKNISFALPIVQDFTVEKAVQLIIKRLIENNTDQSKQVATSDDNFFLSLASGKKEIANRLNKAIFETKSKGNIHA
jgi:subtilisin family serine protease